MKHTLPLLALLLIAVGCTPATESASTGSEPPKTGGAKPLVVFAQANSQDPWRKVFDADIKAAAAKHADEFDFEMQDASGDSAKQNNIIDTFMIRQPKVLLVSPNDVSVATSIEKAYDAKVPVILMDRSLDGDKFTTLVTGDNKLLGRMAGEFVVKQLKGKGTVLMIQGISSATPTHERRDGFMEVIMKNPNVKVILGDDCGYQRQKARSYMESFLQKGEKIDCVYGHNDEMAIGARLAWDAANKTEAAPIFVGIDACQMEVMDMIKSGKMAATFQYTVPGPKAIEIAADILKGKMPTEKKVTLPSAEVTKETVDQYIKDNPNLAK